MFSQPNRHTPAGLEKTYTKGLQTPVLNMGCLLQRSRSTLSVADKMSWKIAAAAADRLHKPFWVLALQKANKTQITQDTDNKKI
jgi:hypothetical protein